MDRYAAVDLGAESGRVIVGDVESIEVVHRFENAPVLVRGTLYWDILGIFAQVKTGLREAFRRYPGEVRSVGIDTWGVDYGLLDAEGELLGNLYHYRDARTDGIPEQVWAAVPRAELYRVTGIQYLQLNTVYQLYAHLQAKPWIADRVRTFLCLPNLLTYWLSGVMVNEYSHATTTGLYDPAKRGWAENVMEKLGIPRRIFREVVPSGSVLGPLTPDAAAELGAPPGVQVVATAGHDTACAVAAVPAAGADYAYLSSGTWSLLGIESPRPIINEASYRYNFTNEGAADGGIRFLKNITGLWIVQECRRSWEERGESFTYAELAQMAEAHGPARFRIDPNDQRFLKPGTAADSMPERLASYCRERGQDVPDSPAHVVRGVLESLAACYAETIRRLEECSGRQVRALHVIGGGSRNELLCRLTAAAAGCPVYAGPAEATAVGNIMLQAIGMGALGSVEEGRRRIRRAQRVAEYRP